MSYPGVSAKEEMRRQLVAFLEAHVYPNEKLYETQLHAEPGVFLVPSILEELKAKAKVEGLWNLFLPHSENGGGLSNLDYAPLAEEMGRVVWASEVFNCSAPDTGNMEVLDRYGSAVQKERYLKPLLAGTIRSSYCMTEPAVASSDARS
jgi:acyl-CoA dehydrogenase